MPSKSTSWSKKSTSWHKTYGKCQKVSHNIKYYVKKNITASFNTLYKVWYDVKKHVITYKSMLQRRNVCHDAKE